jgi:hypothetical protein
MGIYQIYVLVHDTETLEMQDQPLSAAGIVLCALRSCPLPRATMLPFR